LIPIDILLWAYAFALCVHVVDEYNSGGGFVAWVQRNYYPNYSDKKFLIANTIVFILHISFILVYENFGNAFIVLPLITAWLFTGNGITHWIYTINKKEHSPGLMTSPIYWLIMYFIVKQHVISGNINTNSFMISFGIGCFLGIMSIYTFNVTKLKSKNNQRASLLNK
jgi:hypothetical protein